MRSRATHRPDTRGLRQIGLDSELTSAQLEQLVTHTDVVRVGAGKTLARAGRVPRQFIAVLDGEVEIHDGAAGPRTGGPGTRIGADETVHRRPHSSTVITRTECTLVVIFGPAFRAAARLPAAA